MERPAANTSSGAALARATFSDSYSGAGTFTVTLKVTNTAGQSASTTGTVTCSLLTGGSGRHRQSTLVCT